MRLPDPFTNPDEALGFETANLIDNDPVIRDEMPNGSVLEAKFSAQYWGINIEFPDMTPTEFSFMDAFICEYKRTGGYIEVLLPQYERFNVKSGEDTTTIPSNQKGSILVIGNITSLVGRPKPGDLFKLSTHPKVYKITTVSDTGGALRLSLYPDLFITTTGAEKPVFNGILFRTKLMSGDAWNQQIDTDGMYSDISINLREAL